MTTVPQPAGFTEPAGIYIHIPFCVSKCRYCDFYSVTNTALATDFVAALVREIAGSRPGPMLFDTLYIGGGTPSVLPPAAITTIVSAIRNTFQCLPDTEVTLEINPGTLTPAHLSTYRDAGVNRLNVGVQSFQADNLSFLGRCHSARDASQALSWARSAGFDNVGLDLIYGLPGQTPDTWRRDMARALDFAPAHLSCYMLSYEPGTPLYRHWKTGRIHPLAEGPVSELFRQTVNTLTGAGFNHYEISNFARGKALRSRHNQKYWRHVPVLGFGPAAHSFAPPVRYWNIPDVTDYIRKINGGISPEEQRETLTQAQLMIEAVYLGLRTSDGIRLGDFNHRFDSNFTDQFAPLLDELTTQGLLTIRDNRCALTAEGVLYADGIAGRFAERTQD